MELNGMVRGVHHRGENKVPLSPLLHPSLWFSRTQKYTPGRDSERRCRRSPDPLFPVRVDLHKVSYIYIYSHASLYTRIKSRDPHSLDIYTEISGINQLVSARKSPKFDSTSRDYIGGGYIYIYSLDVPR